MTEPHDERAEGPGSLLALVVGATLLGGAAYVGLSGGEPVVAAILVLIGASALSAWVRSRRKK